MRKYLTTIFVVSCQSPVIEGKQNKGHLYSHYTTKSQKIILQNFAPFIHSVDAISQHNNISYQHVLATKIA